ncbi:hypothetical protein A2U01_0083124, partial [Trifolium medium]|nr:hypothetical protein [Trifolium medium]
MENCHSPSLESLKLMLTTLLPEMMILGSTSLPLARVLLPLACPSTTCSWLL